jgi:hypothetical protein
VSNCSGSQQLDLQGFARQSDMLRACAAGVAADRGFML